MYYAVNEASFPETPDEALGRFVGIADVVGATVTFKILTEEMKVIARSVVRTATKPGAYQNKCANARAPTLAPKPVTHNLRVGKQEEKVTVETVDEDDDEDDKHNRADMEDEESNDQPDSNTDPSAAQKTFLRTAMEDIINDGGDLPTIDVTDLLGRTFITTPDHDGEQKRAKIEHAQFLQQRTADKMEPLIRFKCKAGDERFEQILTYNRMLQWCEQDKDKASSFDYCPSMVTRNKQRPREAGKSVFNGHPVSPTGKT